MVGDELLSRSVVRALGPDELLDAYSLCRVALLQGAVDDGQWATAGPLYHPGRTLGAFRDGRLVGTTAAFPTDTVVPGGRWLPTAAVMRVGVRADATRRGVLTALMGRQLADCAAAGDALVSLRASETRIYGRFGFGCASRFRGVRVRRGGAGFRTDAPREGPVRVLDRAAILPTVSALYRRIVPQRPGGIARPDAWWGHNRGRSIAAGEHVLAAVHTGAAGDDGFLLAEVVEGGRPTTLLVGDLHAADARATAALWRFALDTDPAEVVTGRRRPLDEPVELLLADPRDCTTTDVDDETWLRIVDVPAALAARTFAPADPVLLAVHDPLLGANSGVYRIADGTGERAGDLDGAVRADLECDVAGLAMAYLGDRSPSALVAAGWWRASTPGAVEAADAAFRTARAPWCGTYF